jgi:hypothetical protein
MTMPELFTMPSETFTQKWQKAFDAETAKLTQANLTTTDRQEAQYYRRFAELRLQGCSTDDAYDLAMREFPMIEEITA